MIYKWKKIMTETKNEQQPRELNMELIEEEYMEHLDEDDDELYWTKEAIAKMSKLQRKIYVTYLECGTYAGTAKVFKVSVPTLKKYVNNLTAGIRDYVCKHLK